MYYNENDPYPAQWLRNLQAAGHLPTGVVDERSIVDVQPQDCHETSHFFAGIGGWPYALHLAGWPVDRPVWTGSCPCQPFSSAGRAKGVLDERHLWPAFFRLIAERRPPVVFGEQVASKDGLEWLAGVRADLEGAGYAVGASDLCAASIGAPHIRQRLYWFTNTDGNEHIRMRAPWREDSTNSYRTMAERVEERHRRWSGLVAVGATERISSYSEARQLLDGIPGRVEQLHAYGNAIVPQVAAEFIRCVMEII